MGASASKIKFRESLTALTTRDVSPSDTEFWDELWKIPSSSEEVFELLTPSNARLLRDEKFDNLATLFTQATAQLCQIVETPYTIYFDQALNCVRVLTRVVPFLLEKGDLGTNDPNVELLCWGERVDDLEAVLSPKAAAAAGGEGEDASSGSGSGNGALLSSKSAVESVAEDSSLLSPRECDESSMMLSPKSAMSEQLEDRGMTTVMNNSRDDGELEVEIKLASPPGRKNNKASTRKNKKGVGDDDYDVNKSKNKEEKKMKRRNLKVDVDASESEESEESATEDDEAESDQEEEGDDDEEEAEDEDNEPLALLAVHAAMHMLFLPQFTCEFYEEDGNNYDDMLDSDSEFDDDEMDDDHSEGTDASEAEKRLLEDREGQAEAGLGKPRKIGKGIRLAPRPAGIVWAPGVGFTTDGKCHVGMNPLAEMERRTKKEGGKKSSLLSASNSGGPVRLNPEAAYTRKYDKNRIEVLRLLLAACSDPLFAPADEYNPLASRWMAVATAADAPNAPCLFYSLLNTVISYDPKQSIVISGGLGNNETHAKLVELSAQVLCVLLDCGLSGDPIPFENRHGEPVVALNEAYKMGFNIFRVLLARINNGKDLDTLYRGFVRLLRNMFESQSSFGLPTSHGTRLECHQELLILLWKTLEENPLFLDFILTRCDVCELVVPICYLMYVSRKEDAQVGLIHICTFILLKLSGERSFGVSLNRPFRTKLPCDLPLFSGSHADLVSITLHKIIVNGSYRLVPLYSCFLTIVCNFSPYWRSMSLVASVKLVNLFELFSSPKFLYSSEKAYKHLALLLEVFNNIIQYQYNGNQHLVYAIVRRKDSFGRLASLTLPKAIYQCNKAFPVTERPEYDADAEDRATQVAAMSIQDVDEKGKPMKMERINEEESGDPSANKEGGNKEAIKKLAKKKLPGRFVPTESWMAELKSQLPLETVNRLLQHLVPVVDEMCQRKNGVVDEIEILEVFKDITMVGLLPVPHAIVIRKYQPNQYTSIWFTAYMWGVIFLRSQKPPIFDKECIELFQVSNEEEADGKK